MLTTKIAAHYKKLFSLYLMCTLFNFYKIQIHLKCKMFRNKCIFVPTMVELFPTTMDLLLELLDFLELLF
jgi:hypothetical protein